MTREEAINIVRNIYQADKEKEALSVLVPELRESEDERMMKNIRLALLLALLSVEDAFWRTHGLTAKEAISYIEKQKENPKSTDSILPNCTSDAKREDRWHKVTDSLPDNGREVLAKDKLGNTLLARYDGEGWDVSVYDDEDYRCHNGISKWCEIPSEKQKDHFRDDTKMIEKQDYSDLTDLERAIHRGFLSAGVENVPVAIIKETAKECLEQMKPSEWSEEDEVYLQDALWCVNQAAKVARGENDMGACWSAERWLKSLHPQSHWKPSYEQIEALRRAVNKLAKTDVSDSVRLSIMYDNLKKLM